MYDQQRLGGYAPIPGPAIPELRHSGPGIASFIIALLAGISMAFVILIAGVMETSAPGGMDTDAPETIAVGFGVCCDVMLFGIGAVLGLVGVLQRERKKIFAIMGLIFNGIACGGMLLLILIGLALGG
ncbi:MAG: hypothetical protein P9M14_03965 [Candidatus Alcyoniella australis]|nr:hypothetical protein [Candidatus Alcyoniella australis]